MVRLHRVLSVIAAGFAAAPSLAQTNVLVNGGFEQPAFPLNPPYRYLTGADSTLLTNWTVTHDGTPEPTYVYHRSLYPVYSGDFALYFGDGDVLEARIPIIQDKKYCIEFFGIYGGTGTGLVIEVQGSSFVALPTDGTPTDVISLGRPWRRFVYEFTAPATNANSFLRIINVQDNMFLAGYAFDSVSVTNCIWIRRSPTNAETCVGGNATFSAEAGGDGTLHYQWRHAGQAIVGASQPSITILSATAASAGTYDCVITNECGSVTSTSATLTVRPGCPADYDDGTGTGTRDCGVTIDDLTFYLQLFDIGDIRCDVDGDGGVTIDDLLLFLTHFDQGC